MQAIGTGDSIKASECCDETTVCSVTLIGILQQLERGLVDR
jgi:hypothetical protein